MSPDSSDFLAALPQGLEPAPPSTEDLAAGEIADLFARLARRPVPTGRLTRLWTLGGLHARLAAGYVAWWSRGLFQSADERERRRVEASLTAGLRLLGGMGYLRGAIQKVGQTLASYPQLVPEEIADTLAALQAEAPPMHFSLLREHVRDELGGDPMELFLEFDPNAVAAASLGQVHRAKLKDGTPVAVKVQYPGIAKTIRSDLANLRALILPLGLMQDWDNWIDQLDEVRRTLEAEADYLREARFAAQVRSSLAGIDDIVVPGTYPELSSMRVLCLDWIEGVHAPELLAQRPSQGRLDRHGEQILRATARTWYSDRLLLADPNPGNFLFLPDGRLGLVDFGCCREFVGEEWDALVSVMDAAQGVGDLREVVKRCSLLSDEQAKDERRIQLTVDACEWLWEPLHHEGPFDFGDPEYLPRGLAIVRELVERGYTRAMPVWTWANRMMYGVRALLYTLRARVDMNALNTDEVRRAGLLREEVQ